MKKLVLHLALAVLMVSGLMALDAGSKAIDFSARDINGNTIKLSDYGDKVILLDFWATWCGPCRREIPNLVDIKKSFKGKNFEIISVNGFERGSVEKAVKFVKDNKMDWVHVIDKKNIAYNISEDYEVEHIPTMYIIQSGKILAANLRGPELKAKLKQIVK
ncbi:MAG: TlpA family protein disulfide reductase [bacterium]|nr:TlpA family protein disulfide reductase [bacterium]